jgi:hypothetical protein
VVDLRQIGFDRAGDITLHDLHVVDVVLQIEIVGADFVENAERLFRRRQEEARNIARIDHLDLQLDPGIFQLRRGKFHVGHEHVVRLLRLDALRNAGENIDLRAFERRRIGDGLVDAGFEFIDAVRKRRDAALAARPIAGRQIVQDLGEIVGLQLGDDLFRREVVGEEIFDALEACFRRCVEALQKADFVEQHTQVSRKFRHGRPPSEV